MAMKSWESGDKPQNFWVFGYFQTKPKKTDNFLMSDGYISMLIRFMVMSEHIYIYNTHINVDMTMKLVKHGEFTTKNRFSVF